MKKSFFTQKTIFLMGILCWAGHLWSDNRILLTFAAPPQAAVDALLAQDLPGQASAISKKINAMEDQGPSKNTLKSLKYAIKTHLHPKVSGFMVAYGGYTDTSNRDGTISLPLRHTTPKIYLAITPDFSLVKVKDQTISHAKFKPGVPTVLYQCERAKDKTNIVYWDIKQIPLPADNRINPITVLIITKPSNLYVPVGKHLSVESPHLVLPDINVVGNVDNNDALLQTLDQKIYYEMIQSDVRKPSETILQELVPNT